MKRSGKKVLLFSGVGLGVAGLGFSMLAARYEPTVRENTFVGDVAVGGLSPDAAKKKILAWWEEEKLHELTFKSSVLSKLPPPTSPSKLGITIDDAASIDQLPIDSFGDYLGSKFSSDRARRSLPVKFKFVGASFDNLKTFVSDNAGAPQPAKVLYRDGQIVREPEVNGYMLDLEALPDRLMAAIHYDGVVDLPITQGPKRVPDAELEKIREVMTEFSTTFSTGKVNRCSNIKLAASKLDGVILMPGETLSYNNTVGRRTIEAGFKEAGVYANGRHDTGIGGGICQVSTTLYNAALFANLKIKERLNHSMPVPYVPLGRDATVDYGTIDLLIENPYDHPIAITSQYQPGKLTFRVLGIKDPSLKVEMVSEGHTSWGTGVKTVTDPSLPAGSTKLIEKGCAGHSVSTYRLIYQNGELVERQPMGKSQYRGAVRIIAVGAAKRAAEPAPTTGTAPTTPPPTLDGPPPDRPPGIGSDGG